MRAFKCRISGIALSNYHDIMKSMFKRSLILPPSGAETFFLWGPRQAGKSTLLKHHYPSGLLRSASRATVATRGFTLA